ncbi:hypothetical protein [Salinimonas chungwhensis]|uniref:hypothetical protein n=1 Tax=Salinimonas chungwhensis TaxID=265425 RepID=UPI000369F34F|nr:hypothetical protein [Salinimonas chungwhensis]
MSKLLGITVIAMILATTAIFVAPDNDTKNAAEQNTAPVAKKSSIYPASKTDGKLSPSSSKAEVPSSVLLFADSAINLTPFTDIENLSQDVLDKRIFTYLKNGGDISALLLALINQGYLSINSVLGSPKYGFTALEMALALDHNLTAEKVQAFIEAGAYLTPGDRFALPIANLQDTQALDRLMLHAGYGMEEKRSVFIASVILANSTVFEHFLHLDDSYASHPGLYSQVAPFLTTEEQVASYLHRIQNHEQVSPEQATELIKEFCSKEITKRKLLLRTSALNDEQKQLLTRQVQAFQDSACLFNN